MRPKHTEHIVVNIGNIWSLHSTQCIFFFLIMLNVVSYGHQFRMTWHLVKAVMIREENNHCGALWSRRSGWLPSLHGFIYGSSFALWLRWIKYNILLAKMPVWNSLLNTVIYSIYYILVHIHRQTHFNEDESLLSADSQPASHCFSHVHKFFVKEYFKAKIQTECRAVIWRKTILLSYVIYPLSYTHTPSLFQHLPYETPQGGYKKKSRSKRIIRWHGGYEHFNRPHSESIDWTVFCFF